METTQLEKNKKMDKTTAEQNTTTWPRTKDQQLKHWTQQYKMKKNKKIQQVLKNNKTATKQNLTLRNMKAPTRSENWTERRGIKQQ